MSDCDGCACSGGPSPLSGCSGCGGTGVPKKDMAPDVGVLVADGCGGAAGAATRSDNGPIVDVSCSIGVEIQQIYDSVMRLKTELGFTPYRVWMVWEEQGDDSVYRDVRRVELQPVAIPTFKELSLSVGTGGTVPEGQIEICGISPRQVRQDALLGHLDGRPWSGDKQRFFFEVVPRDECAGKPAPKRWRFAPAGVPELSRSRAPLGWRLKLVAQMPSRGRHGEDRTVELGEPVPTFSKWDGARS